MRALAAAALAAAGARADDGSLSRFLDSATAPFVPIPEIDLDPYSGTTLGLIPTDAPFWALRSLGGDLSVPGESEPLRSDGTDRYLDRNLSAAGAELRTRVATFDAFAPRWVWNSRPSSTSASRVPTLWGTSTSATARAGERCSAASTTPSDVQSRNRAGVVQW